MSGETMPKGRKDDALEKWLEGELLGHQHYRCQPGMDQTEHCAREAWRAAVKHTLEFVVNELHRGPWHEGKIKFETIEAISKMKP